MDVDKYLKNYMLQHNDSDTVMKQKYKKIFIVIFVVFVFCIFLKPVTYLKEKIEYNATEARKENKSKKTKKKNGFFTEFIADNKAYMNNASNATLIYNGKYAMPIKGTVTSNYGNRKSPFSGRTEFHTGIDISGIHHADVINVENGTVIFAGVKRGYGNCVLIHNFGKDEEFYTLYAHLSKIYVSEGQSVDRGKVIGLEGGASSDPNPGNSTGHHLHFEVRTSESPSSHVDPRKYIF